MLGKNYREHVAEIATKNSVDVTTAKENAAKSATFFTKAPECVIGMYIHQSRGSYTIIFLLFHDVHFLHCTVPNQNFFSIDYTCT